MKIIDFSRFFVPKMVPSWFKLAEKWTKYGPSWLQVGTSERKVMQVGSSSLQVRPSWAKLASIWPQDGPSGWQDGHKYAQVDPKMGEVGTNTDQMMLNLVPSGVQLC